MAKKTKNQPAPKGGYRDIPGARVLPGAPLLNVPEAPRKGLHIATKITLSVMAALLIALIGLAFGGRGVSLCVNWYWLAALLASLLALGLAILAMLGLRRVAPNRTIRLVVTCMMVIVMTVVIAAGFSFTGMLYEYSEVPVAYLDSPNGQRVVIMRSANLDVAPEVSGDFPRVYTGYQMLNRFFYLAAPSERVWAGDVRNPVWKVEWLENGDARLYLPAYEGQEHSEAFITVYDLNDLEGSLAQKEAEAAAATPRPSYAPAATPIPVDAADPFALPDDIGSSGQAEETNP